MSGGPNILGCLLGTYCPGGETAQTGHVRLTCPWLRLETIARWVFPGDGVENITDLQKLIRLEAYHYIICSYLHTRVLFASYKTYFPADKGTRAWSWALFASNTKAIAALYLFSRHTFWSPVVTVWHLCIFRKSTYSAEVDNLILNNYAFSQIVQSIHGFVLFSE
jgi:hypothetical protein